MNEIIWHLVAKLIRFDRCPVVAGLLKSREINGNFSKRIFQKNSLSKPAVDIAHYRSRRACVRANRSKCAGGLSRHRRYLLHWLIRDKLHTG